MHKIKEAVSSITTIPDSKKTSVWKIIVLFYLLTLSAHNNALVGHQLSRYIQSTLIAQHVLAILTMFVLISAVTEVNIKNRVVYTMICYGLFIMTSKLDLEWTIIIFGAIVACYVHSELKEKQVDDVDHDSSIPSEIKAHFHENAGRYKLLIFALMMILLFYGFNLYNSSKKDEYGDDYNMAKFVFGDPNKPIMSRIVLVKPDGEMVQY